MKQEEAISPRNLQGEDLFHDVGCKTFSWIQGALLQGIGEHPCLERALGSIACGMGIIALMHNCGIQDRPAREAEGLGHVAQPFRLDAIVPLALPLRPYDVADRKIDALADDFRSDVQSRPAHGVQLDKLSVGARSCRQVVDESRRWRTPRQEHLVSSMRPTPTVTRGHNI